jgi:hypothetical protein
MNFVLQYSNERERTLTSVFCVNHVDFNKKLSFCISFYAAHFPLLLGQI